MATSKTECTELSVAFGLLGLDPTDVSEDRIASLFDGTLPPSKYTNYLAELSSDTQVYQQFIRAGQTLRKKVPSFAQLNHLRWTGSTRQAAMTSASIDLVANHVLVSVKNESHVVLNASPYNLFVTLPSGNTPASRAENWYVTADYPGIQSLYSLAREKCGETFPLDYRDFARTRRKSDRKRLQHVIDCLEWNDKDKFRLRYNAMCQRVAQYSADAFNQNLAGALGTNLRSSTLENIVKQFFRIDVVPYLLTGLDHHRLFAVEIPALTSWKQDWKLAGVLAQPDLASGQSVVDIRVTVENKATHAKHSVKFHVEVRWSHGKFCGNPEGKLYKEFCWTDVPFLGRIV